MNKRPININPLSIRLPVMALVSIGHRISGVLVILLIPFLLWSLRLTLVSPETFNYVKDVISFPGYQITLWVLLSALGFHLLAGIRHLLMDIHIGDSLKWGRLGAYGVILCSVLFIFFFAFLLWR